MEKRKREVLDLLAEMRARILRQLSKNPEWAKHASIIEWTYDYSEQTQTLKDFKYAKVQPLTNPRVIAEAEFENNTSAQATQSFNDTKTSTSVYQVALTKGVNFGVSTTFSASFAGIVSGSATINVSFNTSTTETQSKTETQAWTWTTTIPIPPHTRVVATAVIQEAVYDPEFSAKVRIQGRFKYIAHYDAGNGNHGTSKGSALVGFMFKKNPAFGYGPHPGVTVIDDSTIEADVVGRFHAVHGYKLSVKTEEFPIEEEPVRRTTRPLNKAQQKRLASKKKGQRSRTVAEFFTDSVTMEETCPECLGNGSCRRCGGMGQEHCNRCNGTGEIGGEQCPVCLGAGHLNCVSCSGSGRCYRCNGTGKIP